MGCSIQFVRLDDFIADIDSIDLSANGYSLDRDGYMPDSAPDGVAFVSEVITLKLQGTSKDDLAAMTQEIDEKVKQVGWWLKNPGVERYQVWIRVQLENETYPRQAQILKITPPDKLRVFVPEEINNNYIGSYSIGFDRTPFWEDPYPYPTTTAVNNLNVIGGMDNLTETINGDVPARLAKVSVTPATASGLLTDFWIGWKSNRFGTAANFSSVWPTVSTGLYGTDTLSTADATTYEGHRVYVTFATVATLTLRIFVYLQDVTVTPADNRGSYMVLLRAKMSDTSVALARIAYSYGDGGSNVYNPIYRARVPISGTGWQLYEMGNIKIPPSRIYTGHTLGNFVITLDAERISGTGQLHTDCFILIPIDDGAVKIKSSKGVGGATGIVANVFTAADDHLSSFADVASSGEVSYPANVSPQGQWSLPANADSPYVVVAAADTTDGSTLGKEINFTYTYIPRWRTLRGNST